MISNALGGVKLQVPDEFTGQAIELIRHLDAGDYEETELTGLDESLEKPEEQPATADACPIVNPKIFTGLLDRGAWLLSLFSWLIFRFLKLKLFGRIRHSAHYQYKE